MSGLSSRDLVAKAIVAIAGGRGGRVAVVVDDPPEMLEHIYRAARYVSWNSGASRLEDRSDNESSQVMSCERIAIALRDECGLCLCVTSKTTWQDLAEDTRAQIQDSLE